MYKLRVFQPGFGPRIVSAFMSDLQASDLSSQNILCTGAGAPAAGTLPPGFTNYLAGDLYFDTNGTMAYVCTAPGTNASSTWQQIGSGGGGYQGQWNPTIAYASGVTVRVPNTAVYNGIAIIAATYSSIQAVPRDPNGAQIPQFPEPTSGRYWELVSFTAQSGTGCGSQPGGYVNATIPI
jgi:hypothetical protein